MKASKMQGEFMVRPNFAVIDFWKIEFSKFWFFWFFQMMIFWKFCVKKNWKKKFKIVVWKNHPKCFVLEKIFFINIFSWDQKQKLRLPISFKKRYCSSPTDKNSQSYPIFSLGGASISGTHLIRPLSVSLGFLLTSR